MSTDHRADLKKIRTFPALVRYLRDEMGWPIDTGDFEEMMFEYTPEELGIDTASAAKIQEIKRLRPLSPNQPWGIFFVKFEPRKLPVVALRRILSRVALKKRASANSDERAAWAADDLLFVSNFGEGDERQISLAHFSQHGDKVDLPTLKVLGWDNLDTPLHLDHIAEVLRERLAWPEDDGNAALWRESWCSAFTLRHREVITTSKTLAVRLAELARAIRDRIRTVLAIETENGSVTKLMGAFRKALIHDLDADSFADMYAQTITYGLLSARVTNPKANTADGFATQLPVTNPFLKDLMETFLHVGGRKGKAGRGSGIDFDELGVSEVVDLLDDANMEAVVRDFGDRNPQEDPVIHFYELFLKEYDAKKRMQRGVFYTPRPVVSYIVRSVHELLQTEFGLADGLADTATWGEMANRHEGLKIPEGVKPTDRFVTILDPATGTGTFLVETIDVIHRTLVEKWKRNGSGEKKILDLWNDYVPEHLLPRLHGYELLMAPYAIAHLKIGLKLHETGYCFGSDARARVYLTNALEPANESRKQMEFKEWIPALAHEAEAVSDVKLHQRFTVVIGNPPYSVSSQNDGEWITDLCKDFKRGLDGERNIQPLSDDYIKFIRLSLYTLERSAVGIHGMVTNREYIQGVIHRALRKCLLDTADQILICDLHGQRGELLRSEVLDENVFEIEKGVAVGVFLFLDAASSKYVYNEMIGSQADKTEILMTDLSSRFSGKRLAAKPPFYFLKPWGDEFGDEYLKMPSVLEWFSEKPVTGFATHRDDFAIDFNRQELLSRIKRFIDPAVSDSTIRTEFELADTRDWQLRRARLRARQDLDLSKRINLCTYRPFDSRWVVYSDDILEYSRRDTMRHISRDNPALICARIVKDEVYAHVFVSSHPVEKISLSPKSSNNAQVFLSARARSDGELELGAASDSVAVPYAGSIRIQSSHQEVLRYIYAILHSPGYRSRYAESLKIDFPRLPTPPNIELFREMARLGGELVRLQLVDARAQQALSAHYDKAVKAWRYKVAKDQRVPVHLSFNGPEKPVVGKVGWSNDTVWIDAVKPKRSAGDARVTGTVGFRGVPEDVWNFHIGGYQVCEKWLKDRKGRTLTADDIAHYHRIVTALHETIRLMKEIDEVIDSHGGWPGAFQTTDAKKKEVATVPRFKPRIVHPRREDRYVSCVPLVPLKVAAGSFSDPQHVEDDGWEWVAIETRHRLRPGMFVAQVVGKSMEPAIPDGSWCLFSAPVTGTRQGKAVLVQLRDTTDPETGERYTVKRYESEKAGDGDTWRHTKIILKPINPDFQPITLTGEEEGRLQVIAEFIEVLQ